MTVSMRKMSPGEGYQYLLRSVVAGDGNRSLSTPLTRYYAEAGTPPGRWIGSGVGALGARRARGRARQVHESQLALLIGLGRDPITGEQLGRAFPEYQGAEAADRRAHRRDPRRRLRRGARRRDRTDRGRGGRRPATATGRRLRLHLQRARSRSRSCGVSPTPALRR